MARWAVITGEKGHRKAELGLEVAELLRSRGVRVAGIVQLGFKDPASEQKRYELQRVSNGERIALAVEGVVPKEPTEELFCTLAFRNDAFDLACRWVQEDAAEADVVVIGEVSKLEIGGKGHAASLQFALGLDDSKVVLITARASQLFYVMENFGLQDDPVAALEMPGTNADRDALVEALVQAVTNPQVAGQT
ncbi:MAG: nucleoside-triphosphatase [Myxococcales bacterium]|jgi:nucleoside-triphosphatase THEP1